MKTFLVSFLVIACCFSSVAQNPQPNFYNTIPLAQKIELQQGKPFILSKNKKISYPKNDKNLKQIAEFLSDYIQIANGVRLQITDKPLQKNVIILSNDLKETNKEAYTFNVNEDKITINGASNSGVFYGVQLLRKVSFQNNNQLEYPAVKLFDYPRFLYRGMMLDVARHFSSVEFLKNFIDLLALHNINTFHWHLTDDQGWRIEIKKYPKLTQIGSQRDATVIGKSKTEFDQTPYGGYYTQDEIKEIVAYASQRYITVIPEIDLPGHMVAALASYPELGCIGKDYKVRQNWGVSDDVLCVGNEKTFKFLEGVFDELIPLFPSQYYHIGGDECPKKQWEKCPKCQAKISELHLNKDENHTAEEKLQSYCISRMEQYLNSKGKKIIGWDEILEGGLAPNATVMSWRSSQGAVDAAKQGHDAILTPNSYLYFDHYQGQDTNLEPLAIGGYSPISRVYSFEPIPEGLTEKEQKHIIGAQANLWREYIKTSDQVEYMVLPRLAALSEVLWILPEKKNYSAFLDRTNLMLPIYEKLNYNYAKNILEVNAEYKIDSENSKIDLKLKTVSKDPIYYTLDGNVPNSTSTLFAKQIEISKPVVIKAMVIGAHYKSKIYEQVLDFNKATLKPIVLKQEPQERYRFNGSQTLVDGRTGSSVFSTGEWLGFYNNNFEAVVDLKTIQEISEVAINTYISPNDWIFGPKEYTVLVSNDNSTFTQVYSENITIPTEGSGARILNLKANFENQKVRYVKIVAPIFEKIPDWHYGAGKPTFVFIDEIKIN